MRSRASADCPWSGNVEIPKLIVRDVPGSRATSAACTVARMRSASMKAPCSSQSGASTANSSPPTRAALSKPRLAPAMAAATRVSTSSPAAWP